MAMKSALNDATAALAQRIESWTGEQLAGSLAAELGHLLAETSLDSLGARNLRLAIAQAAQRNRDSEAAERAARDGIRLLSAYESSRRSIEDDAELGRELDEPTREILRRLTLGPATASELAGGRDNGSLSRRLAALESQGVIEAAPAQDKRARPKTLTARGRVLAERLEATSEVISADEHSSRMRRAVASCVMTTLRTLAAIRVSSMSIPMRRSEVRASLSPDLRAFGILESFERWAEGLGLIDIDSNGVFRDVRGTDHSKRWARMFHALDEPSVCRELFGAHEESLVLIVTVHDRLDRWRRSIEALGRHASVETISCLLHSGDVPDGVRMVVDDTTLAEQVAQLCSVRGGVSTIDETDEGGLILTPVATTPAEGAAA